MKHWNDADMLNIKIKNQKKLCRWKHSPGSLIFLIKSSANRNHFNNVALLVRSINFNMSANLLEYIMGIKWLLDIFIYDISILAHDCLQQMICGASFLKVRANSKQYHRYFILSEDYQYIRYTPTSKKTSKAQGMI